MLLDYRWPFVETLPYLASDIHSANSGPVYFTPAQLLAVAMSRPEEALQVLLYGLA